MYRYETHLHTAPVSRCAKATVEESLTFYKELGYAGVFVTNHFLDGSINIDKARPYCEQIHFYFSDYENALKIGEALGLQVFCGVELSYCGTDFLVYGLDKAWFLAHPEIMEMEKSQELALMADSGALIIQAHPFRGAQYMDHIRLYPRYAQGVEVVNAARSDEENHLATLYAEHYGLIKFAGSDNHTGANRRKLAGICCAEPLRSVEDMIRKVKNSEAEIFSLVNPQAPSSALF